MIRKNEKHSVLHPLTVYYNYSVQLKSQDQYFVHHYHHHHHHHQHQHQHQHQHHHLQHSHEHGFFGFPRFDELHLSLRKLALG